MTISISTPTSNTGSIQNNSTDVLTIGSDNSVSIDTNTLHVDATNNRVGVGTSSPDTQLQITSTGVEGLHLKDTTTNGSPRLFLTNDTNTWAIFNIDDDLAIRSNATVGVTSGTEVLRIEEGTGYVTQNSNAIGATQITIADDAVGVVATPRYGGMAIITANGNAIYPSPQYGGIIYWDTGASLRCDYIPSASWSSNNGSAFGTTTGALTGTSATDGNVLVSANTGQLDINNRSGATYTFQITFL